MRNPQESFGKILAALAIPVAMWVTPVKAQQALPPLVSRTSTLASEGNSDQVQAAMVNATANMREQVLRTRLTHDVTVKDFLDQTQSQAELTRVLKAAKPVGGARWVDDRTCQVRMELSATVVGAMLMGIAHTPDKNPPVDAETLKAKFADWNRIKFSVIGSSAGGDAVESARPHDSAGKWSDVGDGARRAAINAARRDASQHLIDSINPLMLGDKQHASDALSRHAISARFDAWFNTQPVTRIEFLDDLKVSVTISTSPRSMAMAFKSAVEQDKEFQPGSKIDWNKITQQIEAFPISVVGTGSAVVAGPATTLPSITLPLQPPDWVGDQLQAEATAHAGSGRLKIGRQAESQATAKLRQQLLELQIGGGSTLADAVKSDPQLSKAVDRALLHARTNQVDYQSDGSVKVRVLLDLSDAWEALRSSP